MIEHFARKKVKLFSMIIRKWISLEELVLVLEKPYDATISLQNPRLTLSDVYGIWSMMTIYLEACAANRAYKTHLSQKLLQGLESKKYMIFDNPEMDCCLFLDPRFRHVIFSDQEKCEQTKEKIIHLWEQLETLQSNLPTPDEPNSLHFAFDARAELNKLMSAGRSGTQFQPTDQQLCIEDELDLFQPEFLSSEKSVLEFWETQKNSTLYKVAVALYSIPPTQVKIEQNFSSVGHVFSERRYRLSQELLEAILLIHLNDELFKIVKKELIQEISK